MDEVRIRDYKREIEEHGDIAVRAKWSMDGAKTLDEAATMLRGYAEWLEELARHGFELREPIQDDYGFVIHPEVEPRDLDDGDEPPDEDGWVRQTTGGDQPLAR